jgi:hypothetical protein
MMTAARQMWTLELPAGTPILTANHRMHRYAANGRTQVLKTAAALLARQQGMPRLGPVDITVEYASPPVRKADRHPLASDVIKDAENIAPTSKALVDGLVMAGVLRSDTKNWVRSVRYQIAGEPHPRGQVRITLAEVA